MRRLLPVLALAAALPLSACAIPSPVLTAPRGESHPVPALSAAQQQKLEDWKIRAGLYGAHHAPIGLNYLSDRALDDGSYSSQCRASLEELKSYTPGLLQAPTAALRGAASKVHQVNVAYLKACINKQAVEWHHAKADLEVASSSVNTLYARALGIDPSRYDAPKVF